MISKLVTPLIFDLELNCFVNAWGSQKALPELIVTRSTSVPLPVQFCRGSIKATLPDSAIAGVVIKDLGKFDADSLIPQCLFALDADTGIYTATLNLRSDALNAAFEVDNDETNDVASLSRNLFIGWTIDDEIAGSSAAQPVTLLNNGYRGTEGYAFPTSNGVFQPFVCTAYEGGAAGNLDAITTRLLPIGRVIALVIDGVLQFWQLQTGTAASDWENGIGRPLDFDSASNAKLWIQLS